MLNLLSQREEQILQSLAKGYTTSQIAEQLFLSNETIKTYRSRLLVKLNAKNAFQLGMKAAFQNLIEVS